MEEKRNSWSWLLWLALVIAACIITGLIVYNNTDKIDQMVDKPVESQIIDELSSQTIEEEPSIAEILQWRAQTIELRRIDSVYLSMPDVVLVDILTQHGTDLSSADIVYIYESNPTTYNLVQSGARAQKYIDSLTVNLEVPVTLPDRPTPKVDSLSYPKLE